MATDVIAQGSAPHSQSVGPAHSADFNPNMGGSAAPSPSGIPLSKGPSAPPAAPAEIKAKALYPFQGQDTSELTFQFNDEITVIRQGGEWWEGELMGRRGLFPSNYVQLI